MYHGRPRLWQCSAIVVHTISASEWHHGFNAVDTVGFVEVGMDRRRRREKEQRNTNYNYKRTTKSSLRQQLSCKAPNPNARYEKIQNHRGKSISQLLNHPALGTYRLPESTPTSSRVPRHPQHHPHDAAISTTELRRYSMLQ